MTCTSDAYVDAILNAKRRLMPEVRHADALFSLVPGKCSKPGLSSSATTPRLY